MHEKSRPMCRDFFCVRVHERVRPFACHWQAFVLPITNNNRASIAELDWRRQCANDRTEHASLFSSFSTVLENGLLWRFSPSRIPARFHFS
jgi:hypothetical protein